MPRMSKVRILPKAQRDRLNEIVRQYQYCQLREMLNDVRGIGIHISRSVLHRHVQYLYRAESAKVNQGNTVVVIVDRATGEAVYLASELPAGDIAATVRGLN